MKAVFKSALAGLLFAAAVSQAAQAQEAQGRVLPVPAVTIYPGDTIDESMLKERIYPENYRFRVAVVETPRALIGKTARRSLVPGEAIPLNAVDEPQLVKRGEPTTIVFEEGGLSITGVGTPLQNGSLGESVRVKNMDSGRMIIGRVQDDGTVRIGIQ